MPFLLQTRGPSPGTAYPLFQQCLLGRNADCDVVVPHDSVSRHHARIVSLGEYYVVEDLESRNGTMLNNIVIHGRCRLSDGDLLRLSTVEFAFLERTATGESPLSCDEGQRLTDEDANSTVQLMLDMRPRFDVARVGLTAQAKLHALLDITQTLGHCFSLDKIFTQAIHCLVSMIPHAERTSIVLRDERGQLAPVMSRPSPVDRKQHRISRTIIEEAMASKKAILSRDALHDPRFEHQESISQLQIRSIMCAPLVDDNGEAFGVIQVETSNWERSFHQEELELLMGITTQAAMAITLARLHEKELRRRTMERDLELAASVQRDLLPKCVPLVPGYEFTDYYQPAQIVGGDYFDYVVNDAGQMALIVADVAGHGIAAAISMSKLSAEVRLLVSTMHDAAQVLTILNQNMWRQQLDSRFITLLIAQLDPHRHELTLACAGHMPPFLRRASGQVDETDPAQFGPPLGATENSRYFERRLSLGPGDMVVLYTDGITEAVDASGTAYGNDRLRALIASADSPQSLRESVVADLATFMGDQPQEDDMCLVAMRRT